jgi:hypothetical protein
MDIHYQGIWRMDWGLGNPNKTAALIALLMIAIWALPLIRRWLFWVALPIFTALGVCLMHTMSRGGFVAAFVGLGAVLWQLPRPWPRLHVQAVAVAVTIMLGGAVALQTTARFAQSYQDRSITNRIEIWKHAPQMIVDAPAGWGVGNAGNAYSSWYQPISDGEQYRTLVNSHLTWLVEFGWPLRILYVFGWFVVFVVCYGGAAQYKSGYGIAFGLWAAFFVASTFSSVAEVPWLWAAPVVSLCAVFISRFRTRLWPTRLAWACGMGVALAALSVLYVIGTTGSAKSVFISNNGSICVGTRNPKLWVVANPRVTPNAISSNYPRDLREYSRGTAQPPEIGFASSLAELPNLAGCKLAIIGALPKEEWHALSDRVQSCEKLLLISPDVVPSELNLPTDILAKTNVAFGEFSNRSSVSSWRNVGRYQQVEGVGDFFQNWPEIVFTSLK